MNTTRNETATILVDTRQMATESILRNANLIDNVKRAMIPIPLLSYAQYQRPCNMNKVHKIADAWDDYRASEIVVSYRGGEFYVVDGQHTVKAATYAGKSALYCKIYENLTFEEEAALFVDLNLMRTPVSNAHRYRALICAGANAALELENLCKEFGIVTMPKCRGDQPVLRSLRTAQYTIRVCGVEGLRWAFEVIQEANWQMERGAYTETMLLTLRALYKSHICELERTKNRLVALLEHVSFDLLCAKANITYLGRGRQRALVALLEKYLAENALPELV